MPRATKAALASPNVVRLPTAAPRKVSNVRYAEQRKAVRVAREREPWPGEHKWPFQRAQEAEEAVLGTAKRTPELLIVMTMLELMEPEQKAKIAERVATFAAALNDDPSAAAALITNKLAKAHPKQALPA
jgi:hypothetical protein